MTFTLWILTYKEGFSDKEEKRVRKKTLSGGQSKECQLVGMWRDMKRGRKGEKMISCG